MPAKVARGVAGECWLESSKPTSVHGRHGTLEADGLEDGPPTGFVDTVRSGTMVYEERTGRGTSSQEVHPGI
jgi:hypothetical protein